MTLRGCIGRMPRTPPSGADSALIQTLAERGVRVTAYQLERWRTAGYLPRNPRTSLGRGRGTRAALTDEVITRAEALARSSQQGRRPLASDALLTALQEHDVVTLRSELIRHLKALASRARANIEPGAKEDCDEHAQARLDAAKRLAATAGRLPGIHNHLVDAGTEAGHDTGAVARLPKMKQPAAFAQLSMRLFATGSDDVGFDELAEAIGATFRLSRDEVEELRSSMARHEVEDMSHDRDPWARLPPVHNAKTLIFKASNTDDDALMDVATLIFETAILQLPATLGALAAIHGANIPGAMASKAALRMLSHPTWQSWGQYITHYGIIHAPSVAFTIATGLNSPQLLAQLPEYRQLLLDSLNDSFPRE